MYNTESKHQCELWALNDNDVKVVSSIVTNVLVAWWEMLIMEEVMCL